MKKIKTFCECYDINIDNLSFSKEYIKELPKSIKKFFSRKKIKSIKNDQFPKIKSTIKQKIKRKSHQKIKRKLKRVNNREKTNKTRMYKRLPVKLQKSRKRKASNGKKIRALIKKFEKLKYNNN